MIENNLLYIFVTIFFLLLFICFGLVVYSAQRAAKATKIHVPLFIILVMILVFFLLVCGILIEGFMLFF